VGEVRRRAAAADLRVLAARGGELEREFPFGVVRQLFEPVILGDGGNGAVFAGAAGAARPIFEVVETAASGDGAADPSFAVLHGLFWLTVNLSGERPLVVAVDDLHWSDHASLRFLAYLVRRLEGLPVLTIVSLRPSEPGIDTELLGEIAGDPLSISVRPGRSARLPSRSSYANASARARNRPSPPRVTRPLAATPSCSTSC
jgi:AAA ATPase domain